MRPIYPSEFELDLTVENQSSPPESAQADLNLVPINRIH